MMARGRYYNRAPGDDYLTVISSSQRVEARLESFGRFIFHDFSPIPSEAENTLPLP